MTKFILRVPHILLCAIQLAVGILLLIEPIWFTRIVIMASGVALLLLGVHRIISYFRTPAPIASGEKTLLRGLCCICVGLFGVLGSRWVLDALSTPAFLYGAGLLLSALVRIQWCADALRCKKGKWQRYAPGAVLALCLAGGILFVPFGSDAALWIFAGIALILAGAADGIILVLSFRDKSPAETEKNPNDANQTPADAGNKPEASKKLADAGKKTDETGNTAADTHAASADTGKETEHV